MLYIVYYIGIQLLRDPRAAARRSLPASTKSSRISMVTSYCAKTLNRVENSTGILYIIQMQAPELEDSTACKHKKLSFGSPDIYEI
jgi:hypothetical protein